MYKGLLALGGLLATASLYPREATSVTGQWLVALSPPNRGETVFRMRIEQNGPSSWMARSRLGAASAFVSWPKYQFGRLTGKVPAEGALVYVDAGTIDSADGLPRLRGRMQSPVFGTFHIVAKLTGETLSGDLRRDSVGPRVGEFFALRDTTTRALRDYPAIAASIRRELTQHVFNPRLAESKPFRDFLADVDRGFRVAYDDLDALAAFYSRVQRVGTSHIDLLRDPQLAVLPLEQLANRVSAPPDSLVRLTFPIPGLAYLYVRKWDQVTPAIDRAFVRIDSARPHSLILDMRGNPGGDNSAGSPLAHLYRDSADVGVLLTRKWFGPNLSPPTAAQRSTLPVVTRDEGMELIMTMRERGAVAMRIKPRPPFFGGRVYVLMDGGSGSASEPVAHHLKVSGRATVIGAKTPGAVLTALPHPVGEGWVLLVPEGDFYMVDGTRLEGTGVTPHIATTSAEAPLMAAREIEKHEPADGALFAGASLITLARWDEAFVSLERALALRPNDRATLYQLGRAAAVSKQRLDRGEEALRSYLAMPRQAGLSSHDAAHWRIGMIQQARGDTAGARKSYATALQMNPRNAEALAAIGALNARP